MTMQQKFAAKPEEKKPPFGKKPEDKTKEKVKASADWVLYNLSRGQGMPLMLSTEQAMEIVERHKDRPFVVALEEEGLTKSELNAVKKELLAQLDLPGDMDEQTKNAIWLLVLKEVLSDSSEFLEVPENDVILLENYAESIGLSLGDWIKKVVGKAKDLFKKVVKSVTGKIFKSRDEKWRKTVREAREEIGLRRGEDVVIITKDGRVWRESEHPRDEKGRFTEKGKAAEQDKEIVEEEARILEIEAMFHPDKWGDSRLNGDTGVKGIEIEGLEYHSVGAPDPKLFAGLHEIRKKIYDRAQRLGYELEPIGVLVMNWGDREAIKKQYPNVSDEDIDEYLDRTGGFMAMHSQEREIVVIDTKLIQRSPDLAEVMLYHETLHGQERENGRPDKSWVFDSDEVLTTLLTMEYGEANNLPISNGYPLWTSWAAQAAQMHGWGKQKLYDYAREAHKVGGQDAYDLVKALWESSGVEIEHEEEALRYPEALESYWSGWEETWRTVTDIYGIDYEKLLKGMWGK